MVTGGAGYIGSHITHELLKNGHQVVVFDNLSSGQRRLIPDGAYFTKGDVRDQTHLENVLKINRCTAVIHCAGLISVSESVNAPQKYYEHNVVGTAALLRAMQRHDIDRFIFSSSAAVYGNTEMELISENAPLKPSSPYAENKRDAERLIRHASRWGLASISLRYFNAAGADPAGRTGECHQPETHLIPLLIRKACAPDTEPFSVFGDDYPTDDGTCVRDYVHVSDLARAHVLALESLTRTPRSDVYNLGTGRGWSVREVIDTVIALTGRQLDIVVHPRRPGDPASLVADPTRAEIELQWTARASIEDIIRSAWRWEQKQHRNPAKRQVH